MYPEKILPSFVKKCWRINIFALLGSKESQDFLQLLWSGFSVDFPRKNENNFDWRYFGEMISWIFPTEILLFFLVLWNCQIFLFLFLQNDSKAVGKTFCLNTKPTESSFELSFKVSNIDVIRLCFTATFSQLHFCERKKTFFFASRWSQRKRVEINIEAQT